MLKENKQNLYAYMTVEMVEATKTKGYELAVRQNGKICNQTHSIGQTEKKGKKNKNRAFYRNM
ncbi:hypothetical protein T06_15945 [Trichinella sp. T6]|nr:hypothetical protein T06_15945 [Trichinella sp. T6]